MISQARYQAGRHGSWSRRRLLQAGLPLGAAAFAVACGGDNKKSAKEQTGEITTGGKVAGSSGAVAKILPGHYERQLAASQEELAAATTAKRGGTLKFYYLDPPHFDTSLGYSCTIYDTHDLSSNKVIRAKLGPAADPFKLEIEPDLAEKWEMTAPDATEFVFSFRKNVKWQNKPPVSGRAFTAEDTKLQWEKYQSGGVQKDFFGTVDKLEMPDQYTIRAKLKEPYPDFPSSVATYGFITPRELWLNSDKIRTEVIGTGPFIRESHKPKEGSTFLKNPDYWEVAPDGKPLPYLDRIEAVVINDPATRKAAYRAGDLHHQLPPNTADGEELLKTNPDNVWLDLPVSRGGNVNGFTFNLQNPKFKDKRVRNALSMGIDRVNFDALLYDGLNKGYSNTALPWPFTFDEFPKLADQGPTFQYNPAEAKKLLTAAGADNLEFELVEFYLSTGSNAFDTIQEMLRQIGVKVIGRPVDNPTAIQTLTQRNYKEAVNMVWGPPNYSIDGWIYPWYITNGGLNYINLSDPELDNLLKAQRKETDPNKRKTVLRQIDKYLNDQNYDVWVPQGWQREMWPTFLKNFRTHGFVGSMTCYACGQLRAVWLDKS